jgi:hypothetical protein
MQQDQYDHLQTFELYIPAEFKKRFLTAFDRVQNPKKASEIRSLGIEETEVATISQSLALKVPAGLLHETEDPRDQDESINEHQDQGAISTLLQLPSRRYR